MGSPIDSWEGAAAYFTGAGGASPTIILLLAFAVCVGAIVFGAKSEEKSYSKHK
jgi:shikimate 5-dehydrogenase